MIYSTVIMDSDINPLTLDNIDILKVNRSSLKLPPVDEFKLLPVLPKEVPERIWLDVLLKEETEQLVYEVCHGLVADVIKIVYDKYMERQNVTFIVDCACQAWLKLIDWEFYRHDPGEEPSAYPPCYIPKREESWNPDEMPKPSPKDAMCKQELEVSELVYDEPLRSWPSNDSIDVPLLPEIPEEYWFPGKVRFSGDEDSLSRTSTVIIGTSSEIVQKITNYSTSSITSSKLSDDTSGCPSSKSETHLMSPTPSPTLSGAGESVKDEPEARQVSKVKHLKSLGSMSHSKSKSKTGKSRGSLLPPLFRESPLSVISDCRLRNLRLDTNFEITSEKVVSEYKVPVKRK